MTQLLIRAPHAVTPDGERALCVAVDDGRISYVGDLGAADNPIAADRLVEIGAGAVLVPGLVDTHVHVNDPGRTEWEGFASATAAAAAGGVTTIVDMPLNSIPPTCDVDALELKRRTAATQVAVDVGFWGGAVPGNVAQLRPLHDAGVYGFKCFLLPSGVDEFPGLSERQLHDAMSEIAGFGGLLAVHAEDPRLITEAPSSRAYSAFVHSRPPRSEVSAIERVIRIADDTGCRAHIVHLSSAQALPAIEAARANGTALTVETCPHYLCFTAEDIPDGATEFKCCPPIRDAANRDDLWRGLAAGLIDCVVSDHSPSTAELKRLDTGDFGAAWGGIASLQLGLSAIWTAARPRGFGLADVVGWMASAPARIAAITGKGRIEVGGCADFAVFDPDAHVVVDPAALKHKNPITPYAGRTLTGAVRETWVGGEMVGGPSRGRLLRRGTP
jgi:allantoinase